MAKEKMTKQQLGKIDMPMSCDELHVLEFHH
jgi:hypothetical protein